MRRITLSKVGIHFETDEGAINAHWDDLFGVGLYREIPNRVLRSMGRFWSQVYSGLIYVATNRSLMDRLKRRLF